MYWKARERQASSASLILGSLGCDFFEGLPDVGGDDQISDDDGHDYGPDIAVGVRNVEIMLGDARRRHIGSDWQNEHGQTVAEEFEDRLIRVDIVTLLVEAPLPPSRLHGSPLPLQQREKQMRPGSLIYLGLVLALQPGCSHQGDVASLPPIPVWS